jgi:hypothetical protein
MGLMDPQYYGLKDSRWQTSQGLAGDPYYYGLSEAPNMVGGQDVNQPWSMQTGSQPGFMSQTGNQPGIVQKKPWPIQLGYGCDQDGNPVSNGLGEVPLKYIPEPAVSSSDYQGRKWANEFGLGGMMDGISWKTVVIAAIVAAGVSYIVKR